MFAKEPEKNRNSAEEKGKTRTMSHRVCLESFHTSKRSMKLLTTLKNIEGFLIVANWVFFIFFVRINEYLLGLRNFEQIKKKKKKATKKKTIINKHNPTTKAKTNRKMNTVFMTTIHVLLFHFIWELCLAFVFFI